MLEIAEKLVSLIKNNPELEVVVDVPENATRYIRRPCTLQGCEVAEYQRNERDARRKCIVVHID